MAGGRRGERQKRVDGRDRRERESVCPSCKLGRCSRCTLRGGRERQRKVRELRREVEAQQRVEVRRQFEEAAFGERVVVA